MAADAITNVVPTPAHVPRELVRSFPYMLGAKTTEDPFSYVADIHKGPEIFWVEKVFAGVEGAWIPRRAEDVQAVFLDHEHFTARDVTPFAGLVEEDWYLVPLERDPPEHTALRNALNPLFAPKRMALLEDKIRKRAREHVLAIKKAGSCEFMKDFAFEFPIKVFLNLMGLPEELVGQFLAWEHALAHESDLEGIKRATREANAYLRTQCDDRRINPRDDFITYAVQLEVGGRKISERELTGLCFTLFIAGLDTVSTNMGLQFRHLAERPDHQAILRRHPEMIPDAINELMRYYGAITQSRRCVKETTVRGQTIRVGDKVLLCSYLANRDPSYYNNAEEFILDRKPRHVTFGYGVHICLGMHLARQELRIAMEEFLAEIPEFRIAPGAKVESYLAATIQPVALPLTWDVKEHAPPR